MQTHIHNRRLLSTASAQYDYDELEGAVMSYLIWTNKVKQEKDFAELEALNFDEVISFLRSKGRNIIGNDSLSDVWEEVDLQFSLVGHRVADAIKFGTLLVISKSFFCFIKSELDKASIEFLPVTIHSELLTEQYGVLRVLDVCDVLDRKLSVFEEYDDGMIDSIDVLRIDTSKSSGEEIFDLGSMEWIVCVDSVLVEKIKENKFTGVSFKKDSEWSPY